MRKTLLAIALLSAALCATAAEPSHDEALRIRRTPVVEAVEKTHAAVVNISTEQVVAIRRGLGPSMGNGQDPMDQLFNQFFQGPVVERRKVQSPLGSGAIITPDGLVMTNEHVVRRATNIKLSLDTGDTLDAELLAADSTHDLALLRARSDKPLHAIRMGASNDLMLGETVVALGNPFGFNNSVTAGVVSALNREIEIPSGNETRAYSGLIQTSALINPGNSGGPLVNALGEMVGINSAVVDQAQGIGFAIPIDRARDVLANLLSAPQVSEAACGFRGENAPDRAGARVTQIDPQGAAKGQLEVGDIIRHADGERVRDYFDFLIRLVQHKPQDTMTLQVVRGGKEVEVALTLGKTQVPSPMELLTDKLGVTGQDLTKPLARRMGVPVDTGLLLNQVAKDSPAEHAGLAKGDVIVQIGSTPVRSLRDAAGALRTTIAGETVSIAVIRRDYLAYAQVTVAK